MGSYDDSPGLKSLRNPSSIGNKPMLNSLGVNIRGGKLGFDSPPDRKTSNDYSERVQIAITDQHFAKVPQKSQFKRNQRSESMNSSATIDDSSGDSGDEYYNREGSEDTKSLDERRIIGRRNTSQIKANPLRLSGKQLLKPQISPVEHDESDEEIPIFSKERENFLFRGHASSGREGHGDDYDLPGAREYDR